MEVYEDEHFNKAGSPDRYNCEVIDDEQANGDSNNPAGHVTVICLSP